MLSITNSVADVKARLEDSYSDYDYDSEFQFSQAVTIALADSKLLWVRPVIGTTSYALIEAKDKVALTEKEDLIYWAEVYFACAEFMTKRESKLNNPVGGTSNSNSEKLTVEGYTYESKADSNAKESQAYSINIIKKNLFDKAFHYMALAGWNAYQLQRGGSCFGADNSNLAYGDIT